MFAAEARRSLVSKVFPWRTVVLVFMALHSGLVSSHEPISLAVVWDEATPLRKFAERALGDAFERAGLDVSFRPVTPLRGLNLANDGELDGDAMRIMDVQDDYPNLVAVPTPLATLQLVMYGPAPAPLSWTRSQIRSFRVSIAYCQCPFYMKNTRGMAVIATASSSAALALVVDNRAQAMMQIYGGDPPDLPLDLEATLPPPPFIPWPYEWASEPFHLFLNKRHAALVPALDAALQGMQSEGLLRRYYLEELAAAGLRPLLPQPPASGRVGK